MERAIFRGDMFQMMNTDSKWNGTGNRAFTVTEMETFIGHLWAYIDEKMSTQLDELALVGALLKTERIVSAQDRAVAIKKILRL